MDVIMATLWQQGPNLWIIELDTPLPNAQSDQVPRWTGDKPSVVMLNMVETLHALKIELPVHLTYAEDAYTGSTNTEGAQE